MNVNFIKDKKRVRAAQATSAKDEVGTHFASARWVSQSIAGRGLGPPARLKWLSDNGGHCQQKEVLTALGNSPLPSAHFV